METSDALECDPLDTTLLATQEHQSRTPLSEIMHLVLLKIRPQKTAEDFIFMSSVKTTATISREMNTFKTYFYLLHLNNWKTILFPLPQQYHVIPSIAFVFLFFFPI